MPKSYKAELELIGYTFDELSTSIKQCLYEDDYENIAMQVEFNEFEEGFREQLISGYGAESSTLKVFYDVSYSQGAGACFTGELDVVEVINKLDDRWSETLEKIKSGILAIDAISVIRCGQSNFYCHEKTCRVVIDYTYDDGDEENDSKIESLESFLTVEFRDQLVSFHTRLESYFEEATSFDAYCDYPDEDTVYTADGKVVDREFIKNAHASDGYQLPLDFDTEPTFWRKTFSSLVTYN